MTSAKMKIAYVIVGWGEGCAFYPIGSPINPGGPVVARIVKAETDPDNEYPVDRCVYLYDAEGSCIAEIINQSMTISYVKEPSA